MIAHSPFHFVHQTELPHCPVHVVFKASWGGSAVPSLVIVRRGIESSNKVYHPGKGPCRPRASLSTEAVKVSVLPQHQRIAIEFIWDLLVVDVERLGPHIDMVPNT